MSLPIAFLIGWSGLIFWVLGQIWFAQVVVYPLFGRVNAEGYRDVHLFYARRIPVPVIVPGFASFVAPVPLALFGPAIPAWMHGANIAAALVGLIVTVAIEIPRHARLEQGGKDDTIIAELVRFNWPRTLSISVQALVTLAMLAHVLVAR